MAKCRLSFEEALGRFAPPFNEIFAIFPASISSRILITPPALAAFTEATLRRDIPIKTEDLAGLL